MSRDILELGSSLGYLDELYELQQSEPGAVDPSWNSLIGPVATPTTPANGTPKTNGQGAKAPTIASPALSAESIASPALPGRAAPPYGGAELIDEPQNGMAVQTPHETLRDDEIAISRGTTRRMPTFTRPGAVTMSPIVAVPSVWPLVNSYRTRGHYAANLDPLGLLETARITELDPATWGFADPNARIEPTGVHGLPTATVAELVGLLQRTYSSSVGLEFM